MSNFGETYKKGSVLMQNALKKYAEGDFEGGDIDRKQANEFFDLAEKEMSVSVTNTSMLYGENRNFGIIYHVIEENIQTLLEDKKYNVIKKLVKLIKENKVLNDQFKFYQKIINNKGVISESMFVNEISKLTPNYDKNEIVENNQKLVDFIHNNKLNEMVEIEDDKFNLYEAIETLILNNKNIMLENVIEFANAKTLIENYVKENKGTIEENKLTYNETLDKLCEKYDNELNEDEINLVKQISGSEEEKKNVFETIKKDTISVLDEEINNTDNDNQTRLKNIKNIIESKQFNNDTLLIDISNMMEIQETLEKE